MWATLVIVTWAAFWVIDKRQPWSARTLTFWAAWYANLAITNMAFGFWLCTTLADGGFAAWCGYHAWKRRKPRQRKPSKVGARVRDLGHRLVVSAT
jgi:hypothetical protein